MGFFVKKKINSAVCLMVIPFVTRLFSLVAYKIPKFSLLELSFTTIYGCEFICIYSALYSLYFWLIIHVLVSTFKILSHYILMHCLFTVFPFLYGTLIRTMLDLLTLSSIFKILLYFLFEIFHLKSLFF